MSEARKRRRSNTNINNNNTDEKNNILNNTQEKIEGTEQIEKSKETKEETKEKAKEETSEKIKIEKPKESKDTEKDEKETKHKSSKKKKESKKDKKYITIEIEEGSININKIKEYLEKDLNPSTESWEEKKESIKDQLDLFKLSEDMTREENLKMSHNVMNYIIELRLALTETNRKINFLKELIKDVVKKNSYGSNADERELNAYLKTISFKKNEDDEPINLQFYLTVLESIRDYYKDALSSCNNICDLLKNDRYLFSK